MKKYLILFAILLTFYQFAGAKPIDRSTAKQVAKNFLTQANYYNNKSLNILNNADLQLIYEEIGEAGADQIPIYYIFNSTVGNGWVIVSADDNAMPILAYSYVNNLNLKNQPPSFNAWMKNRKDEILSIISKNVINANSEVISAWANLNKSDKEFADRVLSNPSKVQVVQPLIQTTWDQSPYYNDLCPYDNQHADRTVTGCVATAMAQVMKFWNYPAQGSGFHSYNHQTYGTLSASFGSANYDWASMPSSLTGSNNAVATLMYHCGVSVDMLYGVGATGGSDAYVVTSQSPDTNCAEYALKTYFGYKPSLQGVVRKSYSDAQWISLLKTELDAGRPVIYAGFGSGGGHCFVDDGYDANDFFHFNWGWSGQFDGYFQINALNPEGLGTGGGTGGFNSGQQAIIGIQPSTGGATQKYNLSLYDNVNASENTIYYDQSFSIQTNIENTGSSNFTGDYCAAIFNSDFIFIDVVQTLSGMSLPAGDAYTSDITFSTSGLLSMLPGTYIIGIFYRPTGGNWSLVADGNFGNGVQVVVVNPNTLELYSGFTLASGGTFLTKGQPATINVNVINNGSSTFYGYYGVGLFDINTGKLVETIGTLTESNGLPSGEPYQNPLAFTVTSVTADAGTYLLAMQFQPNGGNWQLTGSTNYENPVYVTVQDPALQPDMYEPDNTVATAYNFPVNFSGNTATVSTVGSNCHVGNDYDIYKINLDAGYNYSIAAHLYDAKDSSNGKSYTLDAIFSYSTDAGYTWSDVYDDVMPNNISVKNGGTVYFFVAPFNNGATGTYLLNIPISRTGLNSVIDDLSVESIYVYPNPANEFVLVDLSKYDKLINNIKIKDLFGNLIYSKDQNLENIINIPTNDFSSGIYFINFADNNGKLFTYKLIIQK